jgi:hypothetical protein
MGRLSPALYRLVVACHAESGQNLGGYQNIGVCLKFTGFCQTLSRWKQYNLKPISGATDIKTKNSHFAFILEGEGGEGNCKPSLGQVCRWFRFAQLAKGKKFRP